MREGGREGGMDGTDVRADTGADEMARLDNASFTYMCVGQFLGFGIVENWAEGDQIGRMEEG